MGIYPPSTQAPVPTFCMIVTTQRYQSYLHLLIVSICTNGYWWCWL